MTSVGLSAQQLKDTLSNGGLPAALQLIESHVGKTFPAGSVQAVQAFKAIMGGATGYNVALMLGGKNMDTYKGNIASITAAMAKGGDSVNGWSLVQGTFNQKMSEAKEAVEVLMIKIGTALLPVMTQLVGQIAPLVSQFANWLVSSHALDNAASTLAMGLSDLVTGITKVVSVGAGIISFFQKNQLAMDALKAVLVGVAVGILAFAVTAIPPLVIAFGAWAVAAGTAALATLAAAAPFILIGAVVAAIVLGIILAVQHWLQIVAFLKGVWGGIGAWFQGVLGSVGNFFSQTWQAIQSKTSQFLGFLGSAIQSGMKSVFDFFMAPINLMGQAFVWLYDHNKYIKLMVDAIMQDVPTTVFLAE